MTRTELTERLARALCCHCGGSTESEEWKDYSDDIEPILDELDALGLAVVPREASEANDNIPLPCPCCGGRAEIQTADQPSVEGGQFIECTRCGLTTPLYFDRCENMIPNWNRRAMLAAGEVR